MNPLIERARAASEKFDELTHQLSDPEVLSGSNALMRSSKERSRLEQVANLYQRCAAFQNSLNEAQSSLDDDDLAELAQEEIAEIQPQLDAALIELEEALLPRDENADRNVIMEVRQGTGGEEAALWAAD